MNITVIGTGYVGLVTAACLADLGNNVMCLDVDRHRIDVLNAGGVPIYEPGLTDLIKRNVEASRMTFTDDVERSVHHATVQFIAVGTPPGVDGKANIDFVLQAARNVGRAMTARKLIIDKSTVPVGTAERVAGEIRKELDGRGDVPGDCRQFTVISNPEFLKEGAAIEDFTRPDRIVLGVDDDAAGRWGLEIMGQLYAPFNRHHTRTLVMSVRSAEFTKYAANAMLATRISFINDLANLAEKMGVDINMVRLGIGSDSRIGYSFLYAGVGYGGSCFPKDIDALIGMGVEHRQPLRLLEVVREINASQKVVIFHKVSEYFGGELKDKTIAIWGLAFKPKTDDMREATSRTVIAHLLRAGAHVVAHDPVAAAEAARVLGEDLKHEPHLLARLSIVNDMIDSVADADALVLLTEWKAYQNPDWTRIATAMRRRAVFDGRNIYSPEQLRADGFEYIGIGRG